MSEKLHWDNTSSGLGACGSNEGRMSQDAAKQFVSFRDTCDRCSQLALESMIDIVDRKRPNDAGFIASARVRVTVEVLSLGPYGADWKAGDIHDQVAREAQEKVQNLFGMCCKCGKERAHGQFRVVGVPEVEIVSQRKVKP